MTRMTNEVLHTFEATTPEDVWHELRRSRSEEARLLKVEAEKDETIKALADALWLVWMRAEEVAKSMPGDRTARDLCVMDATVPIFSSTTLATVLDTLRLAGRLP